MRRDQSLRMSGKMTAAEIEDLEDDLTLTDDEWWAKNGTS